MNLSFHFSKQSVSSYRWQHEIWKYLVKTVYKHQTWNQLKYNLKISLNKVYIWLELKCTSIIIDKWNNYQTSKYLVYDISSSSAKYLFLDLSWLLESSIPDLHWKFSEVLSAYVLHTPSVSCYFIRIVYLQFCSYICIYYPVPSYTYLYNTEEFHFYCLHVVYYYLEKIQDVQFQ